MVVIGDDAGDDDEYEYDGGEDCGDDGGLVQDWCKQSGEQPVQPTSPNLNSTTLSSPKSSSASVAPNFFELFFPPCYCHKTGLDFRIRRNNQIAIQGFRFWFNKVKCNENVSQTKKMMKL